MSPSLWQIAVVIVLVVLLFGRGKISSLMGDVAKGIKSFKKGMASDVNSDVNSEVNNQGVQKNISENQDTSENQDIDKKE